MQRRATRSGAVQPGCIAGRAPTGRTGPRDFVHRLLGCWSCLRGLTSRQKRRCQSHHGRSSDRAGCQGMSQVSEPDSDPQCRHNGNQPDELAAPSCQRDAAGGFSRQLMRDQLFSFRHLKDSFGGSLDNPFVFPKITRGRKRTPEFLDPNSRGGCYFGRLGRSVSESPETLSAPAFASGGRSRHRGTHPSRYGGVPPLVANVRRAGLARSRSVEVPHTVLGQDRCSGGCQRPEALLALSRPWELRF